jgi:ribulose-5-phosphate 4-epimerase/fuculose-1-phosphate aldolase
MNDSFRDEGVVKYQVHHANFRAPSHPLLNQLDEVRTKLFDLGLIGSYADGVGYGNVSLRDGSACIISGTSTGAIRVLGEAGYCYVRSFDLQKNWVETFGPIRASSESMTHCAVYQARNSINCVLHVHNRQLWQRLLDLECDSTKAHTPYGTPQIAFEVATLIGSKRESSSFMVMAGHEDGIIVYGETISSAFEQILDLLGK